MAKKKTHKERNPIEYLYDVFSEDRNDVKVKHNKKRISDMKRAKDFALRITKEYIADNNHLPLVTSENNTGYDLYLQDDTFWNLVLSVYVEDSYK